MAPPPAPATRSAPGVVMVGAGTRARVMSARTSMGAGPDDRQKLMSGCVFYHAYNSFMKVFF